MPTRLIAVLVLSIGWIVIPAAQSAPRIAAFGERVRNGSDVVWLEQIADRATLSFANGAPTLAATQ